MFGLGTGDSASLDGVGSMFLGIEIGRNENCSLELERATAGP